MQFPKIIESLPSYTQQELDRASQLLDRHGQHNAMNNNRCFEKTIGAIYEGDYSRKSMKRSFLKDTIFKNSDLTRAAATGSKFLDCSFENCILENVNFQFCDFSGSMFISSDAKYGITGCNFNESNFTCVCLSDIEILGSSFANVLFRDSEIKNCGILSSTFENASFLRTSFENIALRNLNLDYSEFIDVKMKNVVLPFAQVPYIFGGLMHIFKSKDDVSISSKINERGVISVDEYINALNQLEIYYLSIHEYFPLANIYLAQERHELFYNAIINGLFGSIHFKDFRQLKFYCKLASTGNVFSPSELSKLFDKIETWMPVKSFTPAELHDYEIHIGEIRSLLLNAKREQLSIQFKIKTKIQHNEGSKIGELIGMLTNYFNFIDKSIKIGYIEIRHNSPYEILLQVINSDLTVISSAIAGIYMLLMKSNKLVQEYANTIAKIYDVRLKKHTVEQNEQLIKNNIEIAEVSHHISGMENTNISSINKTIIHYHLKE